MKRYLASSHTQVQGKSLYLLSVLREPKISLEYKVYFFQFYLFILLYNIVLVLPYIDMDLPV